jgi:hypothetical protein
MTVLCYRGKHLSGKKSGMTQRRRRLLIAAALTVAAIAIGPGLFRRYLVHHHRHRLRLAMEQKLADAPAIEKLPVIRAFFPKRPPYVDKGSWEIEQADKHRAALVALGELETERFVLKNLKHSTREGQHFTRFLLKSTHPLDVYWESPWSRQPIPLEFTFWSERGEMEKWRRLIAKYDVPNYWEIRDQSVQLSEPVIEDQ